MSALYALHAPYAQISTHRHIETSNNARTGLYTTTFSATHASTLLRQHINASMCTQYAPCALRSTSSTHFTHYTHSTHSPYTICLCASVRLCLCASVHLCICASVPLCLYASVPLCLCAPVPLCLCASVPLCLCASVPPYSDSYIHLCQRQHQRRLRFNHGHSDRHSPVGFAIKALAVSGLRHQGTRRRLASPSRHSPSVGFAIKALAVGWLRHQGTPRQWASPSRHSPSVGFAIKFYAVCSFSYSIFDFVSVRGSCRTIYASTFVTFNQAYSPQRRRAVLNVGAQF